MFNVDGDTGDVICRQGDSGEITFMDIPRDRNYLVYFSVYNQKRKIIFELQGTPFEGTITFYLSPEDMDKLEVKVNDSAATYYYGVKICVPEDDFEDTVLVADKELGELNIMTVYPKIVEGTI